MPLPAPLPPDLPGLCRSGGAEATPAAPGTLHASAGLPRRRIHAIVDHDGPVVIKVPATPGPDAGANA